MPTKRNRPRKAVTLDPAVIAYVDAYAIEHNHGTWSAAVEAIIEEHAAGARAVALAAAVAEPGTAAGREPRVPGVLRPEPTPWMSL